MAKDEDPKVETASGDRITLEEAAQAVPGATRRSPLRMPLAAWKAIFKRVYVMTGFHNLGLLSAGVAFFAFLASVPLLASVVLVYGLLGDPQTVASSLDLLSGFAPPDVLSIVRRQLMAVIETRTATTGLGLLLALLLSFYGAMQAASSMMSALNIIYEEDETRPLLRRLAVAAGMTLCMVILAVTGIVAVTLFALARSVLASYIGDAATVLVQVATWLLSGAIVSAILGIFFRYAPDRRAAKWRWLTLGSIVATLLWVLITATFGFYVANLSGFNATYGSLSAVVAFLAWLGWSAYVVLLGAALNAETERQTLEDSTVGPDRPLGQRGAVMADNLVVDRASRALLEKKRRRKADRRASKT